MATEKLPKDFAFHPWSSVFQNSETETVARNVMVILGRTGNTWRPLSWEEYEAERLKDINTKNAVVLGERALFDKVIGYCKSPETAALLCKDWKAVAGSETPKSLV